MVLISTKKYACETCIKGHRSSACKHTDRPLFEIKKKGRPVTQCEHCRELRKTKQVHVKCICEVAEDAIGGPSSSKKGNHKVLECAAFPNGLPEALEASVTLQLLSEGVSSDSDHGVCTCKEGGVCHCCTPRKSVPRNRKKAAPDPEGTATEYPSHPTQNIASSSSQSQTPSRILARIAELRPVLPRPQSSDRPGSGPLHNPSSGTAHGLFGRQHTHEGLLYSPYGRAYDYAHSDQTYDDVPSQAIDTLPPHNYSPSYLGEPSFRDQLQQLALAPWAALPGSGSTERIFPSMCGCGDNCGCPGCLQHNNSGVTSSLAFSSCKNPSGCASCLDCTILSLPAALPLPPDTALSIYDPSQTAVGIDEWLRQVSSLSPPTPDLESRAPSADMYDQQSQQHSPQLPPAPWDVLMPIPKSSEPASDPPAPPSSSGDCDVLDCTCPPGLCDCGSKSPDDFGESSSNGGRLTGFATSGERVSAAFGEAFDLRDADGDSALSTPFQRHGHQRSVSVDAAGFLTVPEILERSRSPSTSSERSLFSGGEQVSNSSSATSFAPPTRSTGVIPTRANAGASFRAPSPALAPRTTPASTSPNRVTYPNIQPPYGLPSKGIGGHMFLSRY